MARPKRGNYAYGDAGQARYRKAVREYNDKLKKAREAKEAKNKLSTEKNIKKQKAANKKATNTTKTTKGTATTKPTSTAAKGKSLATGKTTSKTKAVETPQTTTATKTRTKTRTQTKSKSTTKPATKKPESKKPATTKPATKKQPSKKTTGKQVAKRKPFEPPKRGRGRPKGSKNIPKRKPFDSVDSGKRKPFDSVDKSQQQAPKGNKSLRIKERFNKLVDKGKEFKSKVTPKDQTPQQAIPEGKSKGAKFAKKINQKIGNYAKRVYNKAALDTFKFKEVMKDPSKKNINRSGVKRGTGAGAALLAGNALINRLTKPKNMTLKEWDDFKAKKEQEGVERRRKLIKKGYDFYGKRLKKVSSDLTGKKYESSTKKNIDKQKKANTTPNRGLKIKKTERSSRKNTNKDYNAPTATKTADKRFSTFRVDPEKNLKLQKERQEGNTETYSRKLSPQAKKTKSNNTTTSNAPKPGSARAKLRAKNEARFGKAHVDKLRAKNKDFQAMKKKKMTKAEFIRRYPNSITAQKAKGLRK